MAKFHSSQAFCSAFKSIKSDIFAHNKQRETQRLRIFFGMLTYGTDRSYSNNYI